MRRHVLTCLAAGVLALGAGVVAQSQPATVEGCLLREQDVPGRSLSLAERTGLAHNYILTNARVLKGSEPAAVTSQARSDRPVGTSGTVAAPMFDVKGLKGDLLKEFVGKRVELDGTFADLERSSSAGLNKDLVDIRATAIRQVSGECPIK